jgi:putative hydrolase of the HAD superfamily
MKRYKLYIFDFGDTLVSYPLHSWESQLEYIRAFFRSQIGERFPMITEDRIAELAENLNIENSDSSTHPFVERIRKEYLLGPKTLSLEAEFLEHEILKGVFRGAVVIPRAIEVVDLLRSDGAQIAIMSNLPWGTSTLAWIPEFARHGFDNLRVDKIVTCMDVGFRKPSPKGIYSILNSLRTSPDQAVFIGDNPTADMQAAAAAGIAHVLFDASGTKHLPRTASQAICDLSALL